MVAPLYISEISPPEIRGALLVLEEFSIVLGIVIAYWSKSSNPLARHHAHTIKSHTAPSISLQNGLGGCHS